MKPNELVGLMTALTSAPFILFAWIIKYRKMVKLIAGYDEKHFPDADGLANSAGGTLLKTGLTGLVLAVALILLPQYMIPLVILFSLTILGGAIIGTIGVNKYKIKDQ
jgi:hypothetical protein